MALLHSILILCPGYRAATIWEDNVPVEKEEIFKHTNMLELIYTFLICSNVFAKEVAKSTFHELGYYTPLLKGAPKREPSQRVHLLNTGLTRLY